MKKKKLDDFQEFIRKLEAIKRKKIRNGEWKDFPPLPFGDKRYIRLKGGDLKCQILDNTPKKKF